ncbi:MAG: nucleotidyltransferase domain-containing protein [Methanomassiliicoccaceae archaeon]|nr:nucleotidyltransferase domain-containing protein [Methanomassiliicoccaceae archaeon]
MGATDVKCDLSIEELREIVAPIAERYDINSIYLFGSRSRNEGHEGSDYDFYVVLGPKKNLIKICGLLRELEEALGEKVDIVTDGAQLTKDFTKEVLNERRLVYES